MKFFYLKLNFEKSKTFSEHMAAYSGVHNMEPIIRSAVSNVSLIGHRVDDRNKLLSMSSYGFLV